MKTHKILLIALGVPAMLPILAVHAGSPATAQPVLPASQSAAPSSTVNFAVMRNGAQIGTNTIRFAHDEGGTTVRMVTHIKVGIAFLTLYRFDQTESERWADGRLLAMDATTDDNGKIHRASAASRDGRIVVQCDGKVSATVPDIVPFSLWNPALMAQNVALDTRDGDLEAIKVQDLGEQSVVVQGHMRHAHRYQIVATFPKDVWYDDNSQLVRVELKCSDGYTILYQMV